jgi:hypothetical protein
MSLRTAAVLLQLCVALTSNAVSVTVGSHQIKLANPDVYDYTPAVLRSGSTLHVWYGSSVVANNSSYNDVIKHSVNWGGSAVELCPTYGGANNVQTSYPLCTSDYELTPSERYFDGSAVCPRDLLGSASYPSYWYLSEITTTDWELVLDPSVVKVNGQFYMYFDAPRTGGCDNGVNGQIFLARSTDGVNWTKYPSKTARPQPVIPYFVAGANGPYNSEGTTDRYGIGEPSVVYKDGQFYMYYAYAPWWNESTVLRTTSSDGVSFSAGRRVFAEAALPSGGIEVKYIAAWDLWFMLSHATDYSALRWNISRDGIHWLPTNYRAAERTIAVLNGFVVSSAIESDEYGHFGDTSLLGPKSTQIVYGTGIGKQNDPLTWDLAAAPITIALQPATGHFDEVTSDKFARGWAHDPDAGTNDAATNGEPSAPLHLDTAVRAVLTNTSTGQRYEGAWQSAEEYRPDLVAAGAAPDPYHGFRIDLKNQGFPAGTYEVRVEAGEFPVGAGATVLTSAHTITLP